MKKEAKIGFSLLWILVIVAIIIWIDPRPQKIVVPDRSVPISAENDWGKHIEGCYYKFNDYIYCAGKKEILMNVDENTFQVLTHLVAKDKNQVYILHKVYPGLDAPTFRQYSIEGLHLRDVFTDKNGFYYLKGQGLESLPLDLETTRPIGSTYIRDKNAVFFTGNYSIDKVENADPESFRILGTCAAIERSFGEYVADKNYVYVGTQILPNIDPASFKQIARIEGDGELPYSFFLWKDSKNIYVYCGTHIKEADYYTFEYKDARAQDKNNYYNFNTGGGNYSLTPKK